MSNTKIYILLLAVLPLLTGCKFRNDEWVDFMNTESAKNVKFKVIGQHETDLSGGLPVNCFLPDGTMVADFKPESETTNPTEGGPRRTSSVTGTAILQELLKYGNQNRVVEIVGTYPSIDGDGNQVTLSGKVILPKGTRPKRLILVSHYTVGSNMEAPSNCFSLEGVLVKLGYGLIIPDYRGYGVTADQIHPYLVMLETAFNVTDMYFAVREWLKAVDMLPENEDIYLMGYSQGGATTMAVEYLIESVYDTPGDSLYIPIHRVFAGGGPYDVKATYERFVNTDTAGYPVAVPLVLQGMIKGNNLNVKMEDLVQGWLCEHIDEWINSKKYTTAQINKMIGTKVTSKILTEEAMEQTSYNVAELYKAMTANSIISFDWMPQASIYLMHSMDDETVPFENAVSARTKWTEANITYNFGHYGGHVLTALRFIYSVQTLLIEEENERKKYE